MKSAQKRTFSHLRQFLKEFKYAPVESLLRRVVPGSRRAAWQRRYLVWRSRRYRQQVARLRAILAEYPNPRAIFIFPPSLDWQRQLFQRPQQLARALAQQGALVFYAQLNPLPGGEWITRVEDRLYVCSAPLEIFSVLGQVFVYSLAWNRKYLLKFDRPRIVYDDLDAIEAFDGDPVQLAADHAALLREAQVVLATARQLLEAAQTVRPDVLYLPNGVEFQHFASPPPAAPADLAGLRSAGKPMIGYYGALAEWFDYPLVAELARIRPDFQFVLIGTKHDASLEASGLLNLQNILYLGPKPYAALPAYLASFDVALLPFRINAVTQSTSPIKLFEYCAGGKPVVSTPLREVQQYSEIQIGRDAQEFSDQIDAALALRCDPDLIERLQRIARNNTWQMRAERILQAIAYDPERQAGE